MHIALAMEQKPETIVPVGIFWDIENCPVPKHKGVGDVIDELRKKFVYEREHHTEFEFLIGCAVTNKHLPDKTNLMLNLPPDIVREIDRKDGVFLVQVMQKPDGVDNKLMEGMLKFVDTMKLVTAIKPVVVLISGDHGFGKVLFANKRRGCDAILLYSDQCRENLKGLCKEAYSFQTFCTSLPNLTNTTKENEVNNSRAEAKESVMKPEKQADLKTFVSVQKDKVAMEPKLENTATGSLQLNVMGFPGKTGPETLQKKLQGYMDKYEGQVIQVKGGQALVNFKSIDQATKARDFIATTDSFGVPLKPIFTKKPIVVKDEV